MKAFDDPALRRAMRSFLDLAAQLDETAELGADARALLDLAEAKAVAGMAVRKRLLELGWSAPAAADVPA